MINLNKNKILIFTNNWISFYKKKLRPQGNYDILRFSSFRTVGWENPPLKKRPPNRKSLLKYAWRLCRVKRLSIVLREGATHVGKLRLIYDFQVLGRSGGRTLHKKRPPKQEVFFKIRVEGFEPPTFWFVAKRSIQLGYTRLFYFLRNYLTK